MNMQMSPVSTHSYKHMMYAFKVIHKLIPANEFRFWELKSEDSRTSDKHVECNRMFLNG